MRSAFLALLPLLIASTSAKAASSLNGTTVTVNVMAPTSTNVSLTDTVVVQPPFEEITCPGGNVGPSSICTVLGDPAHFRIHDRSIFVSQESDGCMASVPYNGFGFFGLTFGDGSTLVGFRLLTNLPGLTPAAVTFTPTSIQYNFSGLCFTDGYFIELDLITTQLVDPVADNPAVTLLDGPAVTANATLLADPTRGRTVKGIAADGVAQLLIRIEGALPNEVFSFAVTEGSIANIALGPTFQSATSVTVDSGGDGFLLYKSPVDFAQSASDTTISRLIHLTFSSPSSGSGDIPITLVRPPVVLVHGNWSNAFNDWQFFQFAASPPPVQIYQADYSAFLEKGVSAAASAVLPQVQQMVEAFKQGALTVDGSTVPVAAVQADLVAYSLGGLVSRALVKRPRYSTSFTYAKGYVHKLITLDTPHLGAELATALLNSSDTCRALFATFVGPVRQNVTDMAPNSPLLTSLATPSANGIHLPIAVIASNATSAQQAAADTAYFSSVLYQLPGNIPGPCRRLLPAGGYGALFAASGFPGGSDLIVSTHSQIASGLGLTGSVPATIFSGSLGTVHDVNSTLFPVGPDVRQSNLASGTRVGVAPPFPSTEQVLQLLNSPLSTFQPIAP